MDRHELVRAGYQTIAETYHASRLAKEEINIARLDELRPLMPQSGLVVDLGCGAGVPVSRYFAERGYVVEGYDLSPAMLAIARREVPRATFEESRIEDLNFPAQSIDIVVSFFAIIHVPREFHATLFTRMFEWLPPGGAALLSLGAVDDPEWFDLSWHGVPMKWSHFDAETNLAMLKQSGFEIAFSEVEEFDPTERHLFVLAKRP
jgi:trans-aconitate methyltransferase